MSQPSDEVFAQQIAEKVKGLVEDRDFLGWEKANSAAGVILKLVGKATDDDAAQLPLHDASNMLAAKCGGDQARKTAIIRQALNHLRAQRDGGAAVRTMPGMAGSTDATSQTLIGRAREEKRATANPLGSPFLVPSGARR